MQGSSHYASTSTLPICGSADPTKTCAEAVEHEFSSNTLITGGSFVTVEEGGVFQSHTHIITPADGMDRLVKNIARGASHNSAERFDPPKCHPKTREAILKVIMDWVQRLDHLDRRCYFMWLYGPAGAGKSAIAQTIAELCYKLKLLAASFFFSRTATGRNDHSLFIATIAHQLCLSIPEIRTHVEDAVGLNLNIFSLSPEDQLQKLIVDPLTQVQDVLNSHMHPRLIIIDGLDECTSAIYVQRYVLHVLAKKLPIPILFLVASRPEPHIRGFFTAEPMTSMTTTLALDDSYLPDADIRVYLEEKFDDIKRDHPLALRRQLPESWPSAVDVDHLVRKSSGQFIYASTVMKYVESPRHWPTDRLKIVLGIMSHGKDTPFADLDALYTHIFSSVEDVDKVLEVLSVLFLVEPPRAHTWWPALIEDLLDLRSGDLNIILIDLHSILNVPTGDTSAILVLHASLGDFLLDPTRSGNYCINQRHIHTTLTIHLMKCIPQKVTGRRDNTALLEQISSRIIAVHCAQSYPTAELLDALWRFNIVAFWTLFFSGTLSKSIQSLYMEASRASQLSDLFTWLKIHGSNKARLDLYSYYILTWDQYMQHALAQLPLGPLKSQIIILFILPQFRIRYKAEHVFTLDTVGSEYQLEYQSLSEVTSYLQIHDGDSRYDLLLTEFFSDPSRSGRFYLDGNKYADFAITFTKYLIVRGMRIQVAIVHGTLNWERELPYLSIILSRASYSQELSTLLNSSLLDLIEAQQPNLAKKVVDIVKTYCNSSQYSALANLKIHQTQETPTTEIGTARYKRSRESPEANEDAGPPKRVSYLNKNMVNILADLLSLLIKKFKETPSRALFHPSTIGPSATLTALPSIIPATVIKPLQCTTITPLQPIPDLVPNNHASASQETLAPPHHYAGSMKLLPAPTGGFPSIQGLTAKDIRMNVGPNSLAFWQRHQGAAVLAYIPYDKPEAESSPKVMKIRNLVQSVFNAPGLIVSAPQYIYAGHLTKKPIYPLFIGGVSNDQAQVLLDRICWSTPIITFFTVPFTSFVSDFVMTLQNIPLSSTHENELAIAEVVKNVIRTDITLHRFLNDHHDGLRDHPTTEEAVKHIANSVRAIGLNTIISGERVTLFNIFATPPTQNPATYETWVLQLRNITYFSQWGAHTARSPFSCNCCKSTNHPEELCPFQAIPGFPVPPTATDQGRAGLPPSPHGRGKGDRGHSHKSDAKHRL